jgi:hypothetical protein
MMRPGPAWQCQPESLTRSVTRSRNLKPRPEFRLGLSLEIDFSISAVHFGPCSS